MAARFECVATLSDDDNDPALVTPGRLPPRFSDADSSRKLTPIHPRAPLLPGHSVKGSVQKKRSRDRSHNPLTRPDMVARTRAIVYGKCRCATRKSARNCFVPFRNSQTFVLLTTHLRKLGRMDKLELDKEAGHTTLTHAFLPFADSSHYITLLSLVRRCGLHFVHPFLEPNFSS